ncbi:LysR family transcriptional regulator [Caulifigura coniformis]|uniref:LysR family transcriptional regulator n=1 Tax=Caulifigura coniformis TaxID=2527983 RepID=UPI0018D1FEA3|nr:LysR family transcriptional regulator [Caulifigura coniformis]
MSRAGRLRYKDLSLTQLRSFCEVCRLGGFTAAAKAMRLTVPAVWEQVRAIESHYGATLFERAGNRVRPTSQGLLLQQMVKPLLAELDSTKEVLRQTAGMRPERITVVSSLRVQIHEILHGMRNFRKRFPDIGLRLREVDSSDIGRLLTEGNADLAVMLKPATGTLHHPGVEFESVHQMDFLLVTPLGHSILTKQRLRLQDVLSFPLVLGRPEAFSRRRFEAIVHALSPGASYEVALETSSGSLTLAAVKEGLGVGVIAGTRRGVKARGLGVRSLQHWFGVAEVVLARRQGASLPPIHRALADEIRNSIVRSDHGT